MSLVVFGALQGAPGVEALSEAVASQLPDGGKFDVAHLEAMTFKPGSTITEKSCIEVSDFERFVFGIAKRTLTIDGFYETSPSAQMYTDALTQIRSASSELLQGCEVDTTSVAGSMAVFFECLRTREEMMANQLARAVKIDSTSRQAAFVGASHNSISTFLSELGIEAPFIEALPPDFKPTNDFLVTLMNRPTDEIDPKIFASIWAVNKLVESGAFTNPGTIAVNGLKLSALYRILTAPRPIDSAPKSPLPVSEIEAILTS